jgi:hypothetical protein
MSKKGYFLEKKKKKKNTASFPALASNPAATKVDIHKELDCHL